MALVLTNRRVLWEPRRRSFVEQCRKRTPHLEIIDGEYVPLCWTHLAFHREPGYSIQLYELAQL